MKNFLLALILFLAVPFALAQHGGHASGGHQGGGHMSGGHVSAPTPAAHQERGDRHSENRGGRGYGYSRGDEHGGARAHWNGRHFENHYFDSHWGHGNRFYWGSCNWYGPRFAVGSWFWFNDGYFVIVDEIPYGWYDDEVYVDYIDDGYWIVNPRYPGVRFAVRVRF